MKQGRITAQGTYQELQDNPDLQSVVKIHGQNVQSSVELADQKPETAAEVT